MGRKVNGGPSLFDSLGDAPAVEHDGAYPWTRAEPVPETRGPETPYERGIAAIAVIHEQERAEAGECFSVSGAAIDQFVELAHVVLRVRDLINERKFASAEAHLRSVIERLNLDGTTP